MFLEPTAFGRVYSDPFHCDKLFAWNHPPQVELWFARAKSNATVEALAWPIFSPDAAVGPGLELP